MTVEQMLRTMSARELHEWRAFIRIEREEQSVARQALAGAAAMRGAAEETGTEEGQQLQERRKDMFSRINAEGAATADARRQFIEGERMRG